MCDKTLRNDALILLGDFNAKIGIEYSNRRVAGRHTLHNITSENGEKLVQLAIVHNLEISSTKFQESIRVHGKPLDRKFVTKKSYTHRQRRASMITFVRTLRGPNCERMYM